MSLFLFVVEINPATKRKLQNLSGRVVFSPPACWTEERLPSPVRSNLTQVRETCGTIHWRRRDTGEIPLEGPPAFRLAMLGNESFGKAVHVYFGRRILMRFVCWNICQVVSIFDVDIFFNLCFSLFIESLAIKKENKSWEHQRHHQ